MRTFLFGTCLKRRLVALLALQLGFVSSGSAYYFYVHYSGRSAPFVPILERFDLTTLNNNTVPFLISSQGPSAMATGDSFQAIVSEIRAAGQVWNGVSSSSLRLSYGGLVVPGTVQNAPAIEIDFSNDIPPGLLALSGPQTGSAVTTPAGGQPFIPITHSRMLLESNLSQLPSYSELFFTTLVHEFGHTLGLQHTFTSSVMSTAVTSKATRAMPLAPDDIAGISYLYPVNGYPATVGSITGTVTLPNGTGVNLASVVAFSTSNAAISTLTNPDGTFEIDGLPPQQYYLYVHPLPPPRMGETYPGNVYPQNDLANNPFPIGQSFNTSFYPGTRDFSQVQQSGWVFVYAGQTTANVNFTVSPRTATGISALQEYWYSSTKVPLLTPQFFVGVQDTILADGSSGMLQNSQLAPGLTIGTLGTSAIIYNLQPYYGFVAFAVYVGNTAAPGPKHLYFETPTDLYVLPSAFNVVVNPPPLITSISPGFDSSGNRLLTITGTNLQPDTRIYFDGVQGTVSSVTSSGQWLVYPPPAPPGYTAMVVALNTSDPQSSLFLQGANPTTYTYDPGAPAVVTVFPSSLTPGVSTIVDVVTQNTNFTQGQVLVGFGTSDVVVQSVQVLSPTHVQVTATTPTLAVPTNSIVITDGLQILAQSVGTTIQPPPQ